MSNEARTSAWTIATGDTYGSSWRGWVQYCAIIDIDPNLSESNGNEVYKIVEGYVVSQCGVRRVSPYSVKNVHFPGIQAVYDLYQVKNTFHETYLSKGIRMILKGFEKFYNKTNPKSNRIKLPYGMDLAIRSKLVMRKKDMFKNITRKGHSAQAILQKRMLVVQKVGILGLLRCSEHIHNKRATAVPFIRKNLTFHDAEGNVIPYPKIGLIRAASLHMNVKFAKNDQAGCGRLVQHVRQSNTETCLVCILEEWIHLTRDAYGASSEMKLYDVPDLPEMTMTSLNMVMKETVNDLGIHGLQGTVASHSLRYGGATMMAAAGFPDYLIALYGGWDPDSKVFRLYIHPTRESAEKVSAHMSKMSEGNCSQEFIKRLTAMRENGV